MTLGRGVSEPIRPCLLKARFYWKGYFTRLSVITKIRFSEAPHIFENGFQSGKKFPASVGLIFGVFFRGGGVGNNVIAEPCEPRPDLLTPVSGSTQVLALQRLQSFSVVPFFGGNFVPNRFLESRFAKWLVSKPKPCVCRVVLSPTGTGERQS